MRKVGGIGRKKKRVHPKRDRIAEG